MMLCPPFWSLVTAYPAYRYALSGRDRFTYSHWFVRLCWVFWHSFVNHLTGTPLSTALRDPVILTSHA